MAPTSKATIYTWGASDEWQGGYAGQCGPFYESGLDRKFFFLINQSTNTEILVRRTTTAGGWTFATIATETIASGSTLNYSMAVRQIGSLFYITVWSDATEGKELGGAVYDSAQGGSGFSLGSGETYAQIDTANKWGGGDDNTCAMAYTSGAATPQLVCCYPGEAYSFMGTDYAKPWIVKRTTGGSWSAPIAATPDAARQKEFYATADGEAEWCHFAWYDNESGAPVHIRSFKPSDNSLSTAVGINNTVQPSGGVGYSSGSAWEIRFAAVQASGDTYRSLNAYEDASDHAAKRTNDLDTIAISLTGRVPGCIDIAYSSDTGKEYVVYALNASSGSSYEERDGSSSPGAWGGGASFDTSDNVDRHALGVVSRDSSTYLDCAQWLNDNTGSEDIEWWEIKELAVAGSLPIFPSRVMIAANANLRR